MDGGEEQIFSLSQTPDKEEYQNQSHIINEIIDDQNHLGEQVDNFMAVQGLMAGLDSISWMNGDDFNLSDEEFTSSSDFGCLSSPSFSLPQSCSMHTQNNPLAYPLANSYPSFAFSSSSPSSIWATGQVPSHVPRSFPQCSSEMTLQSLVPNPTPVAEMQLGVNSSKQFPGNVLMVDGLGEHTIQPSKYDLSCFELDKMKNNCGIGWEEKGSDDDVAKFIREWLEKNKGIISLEDIRSIRLKNSTIERAERHLGRGRRGRMQLVQLILMWAQNHHLKKKGQKLHGPDRSNVIAWGNPLLLSNQVAIDSVLNLNSNQDGSSASGFATSPLFTTGLQPTHYCAAPTGSLYYQEQSMASIPSAAREAQEKRMARKRKMALHKHSRALRQNSTAVQQERNYTGNWAFWSSLASNSQNGMGFMDSSLMSDGSSSSAQMMQTIDGSGQHVSSLLRPRNSATLKWQDLRSQDGNLKFVLQKVLRQSDVGCLGRIVLPKKEAEIHLPELCSKDGIMIPMEEMSTSLIYKMRYRFWPNNNSRMYVLENTGTFIVQNGLKEGDCIQIYSHLKSGKYMIRGMKARRLQDKRGK